MKKLQKILYVIMSLGFLALIGISPDLFYYCSDIYRFMPVYCFLEMETSGDRIYGDYETSEEISRQEIRQENNSSNDDEPKAVSINKIPEPKLDLSMEKLADINYVLNQFFIVDAQTGLNKSLINAEKLLNINLKIGQDSTEPQILIYHSHSQEAFCDSREGKTEDTIVGIGKYLKTILCKKYGYKVIHVTKQFDVMENGMVDRSKAYDYAREYILEILDENPSIQILIDLHRDGVPENKKLVTNINGKETAQIMFYNGLCCRAKGGSVEYLPNPYITENLAFSFQMEYQAALYYPDFYRGIYLAPLRYNLHLRPRSVLLEAGAQTNTVQEVKNAMEPFADILNRVLKVGDK